VALTADVNFASEGVTALLTSRAKAPFSLARTAEFHALDRKIGTLEEIFDGASGLTRGSFMSPRPMPRIAADEMKLESAFYGPLEWKTLYPSIKIIGSEKVGDEDCIVLELKPASGSPIKAYVSKMSWRVLRRDLTKTAEVGAGAFVNETYSDFRDVDGVVIPFKIEQKTESQGENRTTITIKDVKFDVELPDSDFRLTGT
jgi:hypothetical protein